MDFFFLGGGLFKTFLEGSVDRVIYRDYIVNRRSFIYWSLACSTVQPQERRTYPSDVTLAQLTDCKDEGCLP